MLPGVVEWAVAVLVEDEVAEADVAVLMQDAPDGARAVGRLGPGDAGHGSGALLLWGSVDERGVPVVGDVGVEVRLLDAGESRVPDVD